MTTISVVIPARNEAAVLADLLDGLRPGIADDGHVNSLFAPHQRLDIGAVRSRVTMPSGMKSLLARKRRSHRGNLEAEDAGASVASSTGRRRVRRNPPLRIVDAPDYVGVTLLSRCLVPRDLARVRSGWGSDMSSRISS